MKLILMMQPRLFVQQVESHGGLICGILTVGKLLRNRLKVLFTDQSRTVHMIVQERGQTVAAHEDIQHFTGRRFIPGRFTAW